jgi:hypothetical protein
MLVQFIDDIVLPGSGEQTWHLPKEKLVARCVPEGGEDSGACCPNGMARGAVGQGRLRSQLDFLLLKMEPNAYPTHLLGFWRQQVSDTLILLCRL